MLSEIDYLLVVLMEECAETSVNLSKILRFGAEDTSPKGDRENNLRELQREMADILGTVEMIEECGVRMRDFDDYRILADAKKEKLKQMMAYSRRCGRLAPSVPMQKNIVQAARDFVHNVKRGHIENGQGVQADASFRALERSLKEENIP